VANVEEKNLIIIAIKKVSFQLQEEHNYFWLNNMGDVFCVFYEQDSGNISFGLEKNDKKLFVKYAGAKPKDFSSNPKDAIDRLVKAIPIYKTFRLYHY
jgi:serine/threonine protein kinase, bacterial